MTAVLVMATRLMSVATVAVAVAVAAAGLQPWIVAA